MLSMDRLLELNRRMVDLHGVESVEVCSDTGPDGRNRVWLNVNGICVFRAAGITRLTVETRK
jgi:hypothetical protein